MANWACKAWVSKNYLPSFYFHNFFERDSFILFFIYYSPILSLQLSLSKGLVHKGYASKVYENINSDVHQSKFDTISNFD
jgi:hypothetical protein